MIAQHSNMKDVKATKINLILYQIAGEDVKWVSLIYFILKYLLQQKNLADFGGCAGLKKPAKDSKGKPIFCYLEGVEHEKCPNNYQCTMLVFYGICCEKKNQGKYTLFVKCLFNKFCLLLIYLELYHNNYSPICANNMTPIKVETESVSITLLGKTCNDNFCPENTQCHQKEIFAHCCPK